jgi:protein-tyrosine kinase
VLSRSCKKSGPINQQVAEQGGAVVRKKDGTNRLISLQEPNSPFAEAYRTLRTNIQFAGFNRELKSLLITSSDPGEGKTTTIANLAIVMAQAGQKVLLIDADMRKPALHLCFSLPNEGGLSHVLMKQVTAKESIQHVANEGIHVMTAGRIPPNPSELLHSPQMGKILELVKNQYDMILIDTPPLLPVTDAQVLSRQADGVLLVVSSGKVSGEHVKRAKNLLEHVGAYMVGIVLNNKKVSVSHYYY